jgi:acetolactate synthase-1/2/3 large subunit
MFYQKHIKETPLVNPDFVKLAAAFGIEAARITRREDVLPSLRRAKAHRGPYLLEMVVEPETCVYPMVAPGKTLAETLEDPRSVAKAKATS